MLNRIINAFISLLVISALTHFLSLNLPGDPFSSEKPIRLETKLLLRAHYGLDDPWYVQFGKYIKNFSEGNLGYSLVYKGLSVNQLIKDAFPTSALLGGAALFLALSLGISAGLLSALYTGGWQDKVLFYLTCLILSIPSFILATLLQYVLAIKANLLPIAKWDSLSSIILPSLSLALVPAAFIAKQVKENALKIKDQDFMTLAKLKGLSKQRVIFFHLLPNTLLPLFGYFGQFAANILTGSFLVERIFAIPGLGYWFVSSILERDYSMILGLTVFYSALLIFFSLAMDLLVRWLDPRVKDQHA